jgi:hypothetical protein
VTHRCLHGPGGDGARQLAAAASLETSSTVPAGAAAPGRRRPRVAARPPHLHGMRAHGSTASAKGGPGFSRQAGSSPQPWRPRAPNRPCGPPGWGRHGTATGACARRHPRPRVIASTARTAPVGRCRRGRIGHWAAVRLPPGRLGDLVEEVLERVRHVPEIGWRAQQVAIGSRLDVTVGGQLVAPDALARREPRFTRLTQEGVLDQQADPTPMESPAWTPLSNWSRCFDLWEWQVIGPGHRYGISGR